MEHWRNIDKLGYKKRISQEDVLKFTSLFIPRMRGENEVSFKPTCRQGISIPNLLTSRYLRKALLTPEDLVLAAVVTSQPEDQSTAYRVAMEILFGQETEEDEGASIELPISEESGTGIGDGQQLTKQWWDKLSKDKEYRHKLRTQAEKIILRANSRCDYTYLTKEDSGPLEGERLSYFCRGDDPELVDFEESLESLLSQGKDPSGARYEDLIMHQRRGQRKAVVILQDISGSMAYILKYSLIYGAILLYALRKHELAFAFFESDDYIVKRFFDKMPLEEAVASMLAARSMLGTMGEYALKWARGQLTMVDGRYYERECIIISDFGFHDIEEVTREIEQLVKMDIRVIIILPPAFIYRSALELVEKAGCSIVELKAVEVDEFAEVVTGVI
ncbi:MAG: VWA domain-containing protein [Actinomycetota bacterium]|nr:VWA domain-containing protein [Actinomycetota bacterium]